MDTAALRASWSRVEQLGDEAAAIFYSLLFTADPRLRAMFPVGMTDQRDKLLKALGHIVANVDDTELMASFAAQLGRDHRRFGVIAQHYQTVGRALLETLRRALGRDWTSRLSADWQAAYGIIAQIMIEAAERDSQLNPATWPATIQHVERRTADVVVFTVVTHYPYPYLAGQSCAVQHPARPAVWRYLSPANAPRSDNLIEFHVRSVPGGQLSPLLTYRAQPGDVLQLGAPVGTALTGWYHNPTDLLLIGGGTGLAPLRAIIDQLTVERSWWHTVTLILGADFAADLYDLPAVRELQARAPWLHVLAAVSRDPLWTGPRGTPVEVALQAGNWAGHDIYLCGSENMVSNSVRQLRAHGYDPRRMRTEAFSSGTYPPLLNAVELPSEVTP